MSDSVTKYYELLEEGKIDEAVKIRQKLQRFVSTIDNQEKTASEILDEVMDDSPFNASFGLTRNFIIMAMERYAEYKLEK